MKPLAIIPARSGSKGLRDKNIKPMAGKPLMVYSIQAALDSGVFDEVMVSTDSEHYADIAREWGGSVPFLRSETTSTDHASSWDMVKEVLEGYRSLGKEYDSFCLLQPTSPLRTAQDINNAYDLFQSAETAVISVCEADHPPVWFHELPEDHSLDGFAQREDDKQRQEVGTYYRVNGAIYFIRTEELYRDEFLYRKGSFAYIMPRSRSIDIDTETDFIIAEAILKSQQNS